MEENEKNNNNEMNLENKKLGRGLDSLLSSEIKTEDKNFKFINISDIQANQNQPNT